MNNQPNYFAITPAPVRYDKSLSCGAKLMFGEITALSNVNGYCHASNNYFAELYGVDPSTISRWIKSLKDKGYVRVKYEKKGREIVKRLVQPLMDHNGSTLPQEVLHEGNRGIAPVQEVLHECNEGIASAQEGYCTEIKGNNTSIITTRENKTRKDSADFSSDLKNSKTKKELMALWKSYRKEKGDPVTPATEQVLMDDWKGKGLESIRAEIKYTIAQGWKGLRSPDEKTQTGKDFDYDEMLHWLQRRNIDAQYHDKYFVKTAKKNGSKAIWKLRE